MENRALTKDGCDVTKFEDIFPAPPYSSPDLKLDDVCDNSLKSDVIERNKTVSEQSELCDNNIVEYPSNEHKVKNYTLCLPPSALVPKSRLSTSSSESDVEDTRSSPVPLSEIISTYGNRPETTNFNNINFNEGSNGGFHHGPQINYTVVQNIKLPGDDECPSSVVKTLKSNAEKINKLASKQLAAVHGSPGGKKDLALQRTRYCTLLSLVSVIAVILMAITTAVILVTSSHSQDSYSTSTVPPVQTSTTQSTPYNHVSLSLQPYSSHGKLEGADIPGGPLMLDRDTWSAQPPAPLCFRENLTLPVTGVVVCHTATTSCRSEPECVLKIRGFQQFHIESKKWCDISYNFLIGGDGAVYEGRGWNEVGSHTEQHNHGTLGIAFIGTFLDYLPNPESLKAFKGLLEVGVKLGKISPDYSMYAHCQLKDTESPGWTLVRHMSTWAHFNHSVPILCTPPRV